MKLNSTLASHTFAGWGLQSSAISAGGNWTSFKPMKAALFILICTLCLAVTSNAPCGDVYYSLDFDRTPTKPPEKTSVSGTFNLCHHINQTAIPCKFGNIEASVNLDDFTVRYNLFKLFDQPVWMFEFKYHLYGDLNLFFNPGLHIYNVGTASSQVSFLNVKGKVPELYVPGQLFAKIRFSDDFGFTLWHNSGTPDECGFADCGIHKRNPGILGKQGEWGWDVLGSPSWDSVFNVGLNNGPDFSSAWLPMTFVNEQQAKCIWKQMCEIGPNYWTAIGFHDLTLELSDFIEALKTINPQAAKYLQDCQDGIPQSTPSNPQAEEKLKDAAQVAAETLQNGKQLSDWEIDNVAEAIAENESGPPRVRNLAKRLASLTKQSFKDDGGQKEQRLKNAVSATRTMEMFGEFGGSKPEPSGSRPKEAGSLQNMVGTLGPPSAIPLNTNAPPANSSLQKILDNF